MSVVIVGGADEADLEPVLQVLVAEPVEGAVAGLDLDQAFQVGVAVRPVAGLVRVRDDQHVVGAVLAAESRVQLVEQGRFLVGDPAAARRVAEEDVVVPAERRPRGPLEAEDGRELAFDPVVLDQLLQLPPLAVVHPDVVLGEAQEVEPGHIAPEPVVAVRRSLPLGEGGVAVGLTPVDAVCRVVLDPDRIARRADRSVLVLHREAVDAGLGEGHVLEQ